MTRRWIGPWLLVVGCTEMNPSYVPPEDTGGSTGPMTTSTTTVTSLTSTQGPSTTAEPTTTTIDPTMGGSVGSSGPPQLCGDGFVEPPEECDDGDGDDGDECTSLCTVAVCGDGFLRVGKEECDDGNFVDEDDCPGTCKDPVCGDGFAQKGKEECDDGNMIDVDGCSNTCVSQLCSNGKLDPGEGDVDCGGPCLAKCLDGQSCGAPMDCENSFCVVGVCKIAPTCKKIRDGFMDAPSGPYLIDPDSVGPAPPFKAFCEMKEQGGGWTMVFKLSAGLDGDPYALWTNGPLNEFDESLLHTGPSPKPYRSAIVDQYWGGGLVQEAVVFVYKGGTAKVFLRFVVGGTNPLDWFAMQHLMATDFGDLVEPIQLMSILGEDDASRRFYINKNYGGCPFDAGWLFVDANPNTCFYEDNNMMWSGIRILYAPSKKVATWETEVMNGTVGFGETFFVAVR